MLDDFGTFSARTYTADGALPVAGAIIRITGAEEGNRFISYSLVTDEDGNTPLVQLPAPSRDYSLTPNPAEAPFAVYDLEISAPGYYSKWIRGITVFGGIHSEQLINMIPESRDSRGNYPRGNVNAIIPD